MRYHRPDATSAVISAAPQSRFRAHHPPLPIVESPRTTRGEPITVRAVCTVRELPSPRRPSNLITTDSTAHPPLLQLPLSLLQFPLITQQNFTMDYTTKSPLQSSIPSIIPATPWCPSTSVRMFIPPTAQPLPNLSNFQSNTTNTQVFSIFQQ